MDQTAPSSTKNRSRTVIKAMNGHLGHGRRPWASLLGKYMMAFRWTS